MGRWSTDRAVPGVGIKIQERGRSVPEFGAVSQPVELVASGVSTSAYSRRDRERGCPAQIASAAAERVSRWVQVQGRAG